MTYNVSSGTLYHTLPTHTIRLRVGSESGVHVLGPVSAESGVLTPDSERVPQKVRTPYPGAYLRGGVYGFKPPPKCWEKIFFAL